MRAKWQPVRTECRCRTNVPCNRQTTPPRYFRRNACCLVLRKCRNIGLQVLLWKATRPIFHCTVEGADLCVNLFGPGKVAMYITSQLYLPRCMIVLTVALWRNV